MKETQFFEEKEILFQHEVKINSLAANVLLLLATVAIPLILLLKIVGIFIFYIDEAAVPLIITFILLIIPKVFYFVHAHDRVWFKYLVIVVTTLSVPSVYLEFDYMALILWVLPVLMGSLYFNKKLGLVSTLFTIIVLGFTSYYRSYLRLINNQITERIGGLFNDFIISFLTYTILLLIVYSVMYTLTKTTNQMLHELVKTKRYEVLSMIDSLTDVYNHRFLINTLEKNKLVYEKQDKPFSVILFDVDNFKEVNDKYGHVVGDLVLKEIAKALKETIREKDIIGRYGGEEFLVVLPSTDIYGGYLLAERCREVISKLSIGKEKIRVTVSGGVHEYDGKSISDIIKRADDKMYQSKNNGKNKIIS